MKTKQLKVAIAVDDGILINGIRLFFEITEKIKIINKISIKIIWDAKDGKDLLQKIKLEIPDILLLDLSLVNMEDSWVATLFKRVYKDIRIVILTSSQNLENILKMIAMREGVFLVKPEQMDGHFLNSVGDTSIFADMMNKILLSELFKPMKLNDKELRILTLIMAGETNEEISKQVYISVRSIATISKTLSSLTRFVFPM